MSEEYIITSYAKMRMIQRSIPRFWIETAFKYGSKHNGRINTIQISFGKNLCQNAIDQIMNEIFERDSIEENEFKGIAEEIKSLKKLKMLGGLQVIFNEHTKEIVTLYTTNDTTKRARFRVF